MSPPTPTWLDRDAERQRQPADDRLRQFGSGVHDRRSLNCVYVKCDPFDGHAQHRAYRMLRRPPQPGAADRRLQLRIDTNRFARRQLPKQSPPCPSRTAQGLLPAAGPAADHGVARWRQPAAVAAGRPGQHGLLRGLRPARRAAPAVRRPGCSVKGGGGHAISSLPPTYSVGSGAILKRRTGPGARGPGRRRIRRALGPHAQLRQPAVGRTTSLGQGFNWLVDQWPCRCRIPTATCRSRAAPAAHSGSRGPETDSRRGSIAKETLVHDTAKRSLPAVRTGRQLHRVRRLHGHVPPAGRPGRQPSGSQGHARQRLELHPSRAKLHVRRQ